MSFNAAASSFASGASIKAPTSKRQAPRMPTAGATIKASVAVAVEKSVYVFGNGTGEGDASMKMLLGGKGANLAEMSSIGLSVPPGLTITTETCFQFHQNNQELPEGCWEQILEGVKSVETNMGCKLGDPANPLLLSVRSGAAISMPGMMDTVLNLGLNDTVVEGLAEKAGGAFAWDSYRRFLDMFGCVVLGLPHEEFEHALESKKNEVGVRNDNELSPEQLKELVADFKKVYIKHGKVFPEDPYEQMREGVYAVFNSWNSERADVYRAINNITGLKGTAVTVQAMVFGNMGPTSGTGVCFTRNPSNGENKLYGEYLINAQGEDVVAGIRTPEDIARLGEDLPEAYDELIKNTLLLEKHYKDMQDIEFTVQEGRLYMLQCRSGKRTGAGAVRMAVEMVGEGLLTQEESMGRVEATHLDQLLHPQFADEESKEYTGAVVGTGLPASPGAAVGQVVFSSEEAEEYRAAGKPAILVRIETSPEDVSGMYNAEGILTARGGMTSHAAVVARGWGKTCVSGCGDLSVNEGAKTASVNGVSFGEGDWLSLNGTTGEILVGKLALRPPELSGDLGTFMGWVDGYRTMTVLANADTPADAEAARRNGAEGIGLCRTEHMFFGEEERIAAVRRMIMAVEPGPRREALEQILPFQRKDFEGIFKAMDGLPTTVRLLDPPLHEFLPEGDMDEVCEVLSQTCGVSVEEIEERIEKLSEVNPMLGFRGCRLAIAFPEIAEMQVRAITEAAINVEKEGVVTGVKIMVPLIGTKAELAQQEALINRVAEEVFTEKGARVKYSVGTMMEIPRACLTASEVAEHATFFSYGTNDLTQMTFGYSRDDVNKFLPTYLETGILQDDPFQVIDEEGVGQLIEMSAKNGKAKNPDLKVGVCGEHGGEPRSVKFFHRIGMDYTSCSPFRVPLARLAAAQAALGL
mmetsp:Transcript_16736/g.52776  ORF Transcript_16736/g.52776 Transcript_16736/m.52776 type:complete len:921 (+) Transcript_16736:845-3607(+)